MIPELLTIMTLIFLIYKGYKMQKNVLQRVSNKNLDRYLNQDYKVRLENKQILHPSRNKQL